MLGIEKDEFAVALTRVVLWIGHKLAIDRFDLADPALPLPTLDGIQQGDALHVDWPETDAIVGNPPFHGDRNLRRLLGDDEIDWLKRRFGVGVKDYCVYWFRRAHDHLRPGQRAGLIGTNSISQTRARGASLDYVVAGGASIVDAISSQPWPGDAAVHVSIVNWTKSPPLSPASARLDGREVPFITTSLIEGRAGDASAAVLAGNSGRAFSGAQPVGDGFLLDAEQAGALLRDGGPSYAAVVRPFLVARDLTTEIGAGPGRWVIDFDRRELREARQFPLALEIVERLVRPQRALNRDRRFREEWWRFGRPRGDMRTALMGHQRWLAGTATGKRILFAWQDPRTCPSNAVNVFAFDDDYFFGILSSRVHTDWAKARSSTLKGDIRYTPTTAFQTFPFPAPTPDQYGEIGRLASDLHRLRSRLSRELRVGLTKLYNQVDEGDHSDLVALHAELDRAVCQAYGWPGNVVQTPIERNARLMALNQAIAEGAVPYAPFPDRDDRGTNSLF